WTGGLSRHNAEFDIGGRLVRSGIDHLAPNSVQLLLRKNEFDAVQFLSRKDIDSLSLGRIQRAGIVGRRIGLDVDLVGIAQTSIFTRAVPQAGAKIIASRSDPVKPVCTTIVGSSRSHRLEGLAARWIVS